MINEYYIKAHELMVSFFTLTVVPTTLTQKQQVIVLPCSTRHILSFICLQSDLNRPVCCKKWEHKMIPGLANTTQQRTTL